MAWSAPQGNFEYRVKRMRSLLGCNEPDVFTAHDGSCLWVTMRDYGSGVAISRGFVMPDNKFYQEDTEKGVYDSYECVRLPTEIMEVIALKWLKKDPIDEFRSGRSFQYLSQEELEGKTM